MATRHPTGPPMTLKNMRDLNVQNLIAFCLNDACRHQALIDVSSYPAETEVPCGLRQVRRPARQDRRATELEGAAVQADRAAL
jgi:hypothetical protein